LLSKSHTYWLQIGTFFAGVSLIGGCSDSNYQNGQLTALAVEGAATVNTSIQNEYIIVLAENVSIEEALDQLQVYGATVIRNLKRGRYLISVKQDPGIERLTEDFDGSEIIQHIQPNYTYRTQ
jgi:hypothetical protein